MSEPPLYKRILYALFVHRVTRRRESAWFFRTSRRRRSAFARSSQRQCDGFFRVGPYIEISFPRIGTVRRVPRIPVSRVYTHVRHWTRVVHSEEIDFIFFLCFVLISGDFPENRGEPPENPEPGGTRDWISSASRRVGKLFTSLYDFLTLGHRRLKFRPDSCYANVHSNGPERRRPFLDTEHFNLKTLPASTTFRYRTHGRFNAS